MAGDRNQGGEPVRATEELGPADRRRVDQLLAAAEAADRHHPLSEQAMWTLDRRSGVAAGERWHFLVDRPDGHLAGFALLARHRAGWDLEAVVDPDDRPPGRPEGAEGSQGTGDGIEQRLLVAALAQASPPAGGTLRYWAFRAPSGHQATMEALGLSLERSLFQMRVPLPLASDVRPRTDPVAVRPFRPGRDEAAWLIANNRAFADHPEQGGWDLATLEEREREPWFDPDGFLLLDADADADADADVSADVSTDVEEEAPADPDEPADGTAGVGADGPGSLAGSCWTKVHGDTDPPMGEIYVISVDPAFAGQGLGRALTVAGLDHLASAGLTLGMLYVDAANEAAVGLYRSLGFTVDHVDRAYTVDHVDPA